MTIEQPDPEVEALQHTVADLQKENEELRETDGSAPVVKKRRLRGVASWVLIVLACVLAVISVMVVFTRNQLLNTDAYLRTVTPLASDPAIQTAVAKQVSTNLIDQTDIKARVKNALPPKAGFLATPIADGVQTATYQITLKAVESDAFQQIWVAANKTSHEQLVNVLTGSGTGSVSTKNGRVTLDLSQVEAKAKARLDSRGVTIFDRVPAVKGLKFVLFQSDQLAQIQTLTRLLNDLAYVFPILMLACFAGGIALAKNKRRGLVRAAIGLALAMGLILVVLAVARNQYLSSLGPNQSVSANAAVVDIVTRVLKDTVRGLLIAAAVVALIAILAGNKTIKAWIGTKEEPSFLRGPFQSFVAAHRVGLQWSVAALGLLVLVIWTNPTVLVAVVVIILALALIALVGAFGRRHPRAPTPAAAAAISAPVEPED